MSTTSDKGKALLGFLKANATIRRKRISSYGVGDTLLWIAEIPCDRTECRSPFLTDKREEPAGPWLEVRKKRMPTRPAVPEILEDWVRPEDLDQTEKEPELRPQITVLVERHAESSDVPPAEETVEQETVPEVRRLADHRDLEDIWLEYLIESWEPWAREMREWQKVQTVYERLDFMRRRVEEAEERYELVLAIGMLQWLDPTGTAVKRHLLTAPAEVTLDAPRGVVSVVPAASFERIRVELDMLEVQHRPRLNEQSIDSQLDEIDIQAWDSGLFAPLLREIANCLRADAEVSEESLQPADRVEERPLVSYAPAIVLRERQPTAYDDLIRKFIEAASGIGLGDTRPWGRLIAEGDATDTVRSDTRPDGAEAFVEGNGDRFLFPLPANDEQRQIVQRLQARPSVLVKGPPGTGKSHTIANLICHLLAIGDRVLVTAQAPKALAVLRGLLPNDVRDLCVTALGSSRDDQRLLEESVRGILRRQNEGASGGRAGNKISDAEGQLQALEGELSAGERFLREFREAETYSHSLPGGYSGTAAQIARVLQEQQEEFSWFPARRNPDEAFPLDISELPFLAYLHAEFSPKAQEEIRTEIGEDELPDPEEFQRMVADLVALEETAARATRATDPARAAAVDRIRQERLGSVQEVLESLDSVAMKATRTLGGLAEAILGDLLAGSYDRWAHLASESEALLSSSRMLLDQVGEVSVELPQDVPEDRLRSDVGRRLEHFDQGGKRGFSVFAPKVVRETRYVADRCRVNGEKADGIEYLECLLGYLKLAQNTRELRDRWSCISLDPAAPRELLRGIEHLTHDLAYLLEFVRTGADGLVDLPSSDRVSLASAEERGKWLNAINAVFATRDARVAKKGLDDTIERVCRIQRMPRAHSCMTALARAGMTRDTSAWSAAWEERDRIREKKERLAHYNALLKRLSGSCPELVEILRSSAGDCEWQPRVRGLQQAWAWAGARAWLRRISDPSIYNDRVQEYHRIQQKIEKTTEELVSAKAWKAFFDRLDESTIQSLTAWTRAVDRIGKGTGKHAYRHRRSARQYLMACVPKIPAWVMPLHKLWDSVEARAGLFDTVIVDEASQAGVDALLLLLLAKRIIVVGDDKQNSPEAVGVLEDDIARLARDHLSEFRFRDEFRPDSSLFDHAERSFGNLITLREHFRCVPEIIRFSNDLCYRDSPLIPLRQSPPNRVPPLQSRFIPEGRCEGEGQRIRNRAEADAVVETVVSLIASDSHEGKTIGVIALQGHAQAELIESLVAQRLDPKILEERRFRCGEPATFQGDQRDVILLSLVVAPNVNYRALTRLSDQRRFNVAMSRARDQVWLLHSVKQHDLGRDDLRRKLVGYFDDPDHGALETLFEDADRLERHVRAPRRRGSQPEPYESWFEVDVALELLRQRYRVRTQVEVAGKRIDLVVDGLDSRLAIECDGDEWHGAEVYDRDMARQRQLERAGWTFVRVRESEFYADRKGTARRVSAACEELGIHPLDFVGEAQSKPQPEGRSERGLEEASSSRNGHSFAQSSEENDEETENLAAEGGPFTGYSEELGFPDPRDSSPANVRVALRRIVERDGPLTRASVCRLYVEGSPGLQRVGKVVRQALNRSIGAMLRSRELVQEAEFPDGSPEGLVLRLDGAANVKVRPAGRRDLLEIPPSELLTVLRSCGGGAHALSDDEEYLFRKLLDHYGFSRLTKPRREYLKKVLGLRRRQSDANGTARASNEGRGNP